MYAEKDKDFGTSMRSILLRVHTSSIFRDAMIGHELINPALYGKPTMLDCEAEEDQYTAIDDWYLPGTSSSPRETEQSPEEIALRRRRREAMVLGETGRPLSREDIFERVTTEEMNNDEVEEDSEQLQEEISVEEPATASKNTWLSWLSRLRPNGLAPIDWEH